MKRLLLIYGFLATVLFGFCQPNSVDLLKKSYDKCQTIMNGYYEMNFKYKFKNDSSSSNYKFHFKILPTDTIYSFAFHSKVSQNEAYFNDIIYSGNDFITYSVIDSTGVKMSNDIWAEKILSESNQYSFYFSFLNKGKYPFINESEYNNKKYILKYIGSEHIENFLCHHIKLVFTHENDSSINEEIILSEIDYWINEKDYIPVKYLFTVNNGLIQQYSLKYYEFVKSYDTYPISLSIVPSFINLTDYNPNKKHGLISNNSTAPDWTLVSLNNDTVKLSDFKGKLVLLDFFYKKCPPCKLALPVLQSLHERYYDKGLRIIGIDPYGKDIKDDIIEFLSEQGVTYTVALGGLEVAMKYHVSGYPTVYLINKNGKIIYSKVGYKKGSEDELEKIIIKNL